MLWIERRGCVGRGELDSNMKGSQPHLRAISSVGLPRLALPDTLVVIPCSGGKRRGGGTTDVTGVSILDALPAGLAAKLQSRRANNAKSALLDESDLLPAAERNNGYLYRSAGAAVDALVKASAGVLIMSGGYGVVCAAEPIGWYEQVFRPSKWPDGLVGRCIAGYAEAAKATTVVGLFSATTEYAKTFRSTPWPESVQNVFQVSPRARARDGAQIKAPRALGEALTEISRHQELPSSWTSSDGLPIEVTLLRRKEQTDAGRIVARLSNPDEAEDPMRISEIRAAAGSPGLYSWWADSVAIDQFAKVVGPIPAHRCIYVGQTGATQPSGKPSRATLKSRILGNHLRGNVGSSTFRKTISAILFEPLKLRLNKPDQLTRDSNKVVSGWIKDHLRVVIVPYADRDSLLDVEKQVLASLDPPFNLNGVPTNDVRRRLKDLRKRLIDR